MVFTEIKIIKLAWWGLREPRHHHRKWLNTICEILNVSWTVQSSSFLPVWINQLTVPNFPDWTQGKEPEGLGCGKAGRRQLMKRPEYLTTFISRITTAALRCRATRFFHLSFFPSFSFAVLTEHLLCWLIAAVGSERKIAGTDEEQVRKSSQRKDHFSVFCFFF